MESLDWSNHHHHHHNLEDNMSLFMPVISNNANVLSRINNNISNNIGGNKPEDQHHQHPQRNFDAFIDDSTILLDHHHHPQNGPILDSRASDLYNAGLEGLKPGTMSSFGSLDCLISASNSHTDTTTSIEDEGISILFSDCNSLLMNSNLKQGTKCKEIDSRTSHSQEHVLINNNVDQSRSDDTYNLDSDGTVKRKRLTSDQNLHIKSSARTSQYQNLKFLSHNKSNHSTTTTQVTSDKGTTFQLIPSDDHHQSHRKPKRQRLSSDKTPKVITSSSNISFQQPSSSASSEDHQQHHEPDTEAIAQMKEMIYRAAAFRPVDFELEAMEKPKRKNVKISNDPQTVAARQRRERISERIRVLQRLVPGGTKMDTASMLDEAANYLRFLRSWVKALESLGVQQQIDHLSMMNNNLSSPSGVNADHSGNVGYVNHHFSMHNQQPQFSISNPSSSVHPSTSGEQQYCHI